jgi:hypothetical protein
MNVANLQLEGMLLALMALLDSMKCKGVMNAQEIDDALETAEANALSDPVRLSGLSDANIDAMLFPIRFLRQANVVSKTPENFTTITQLVGETKDQPGP